MGEAWNGGDIQRHPGGGHKVNLLRPVVEKWSKEDDLIVMFVDSYDVIFTMGADQILARFKDFDAKVVFSAEGFCWPDESLAAKYPRVGLGKRFLCSGGFIGYAKEVFSVIADHPIKDTEDDQLYYTTIFLDEQKRTSIGIRLDHRSHIFQNLNGARDEVELEFTNNSTTAVNTIYSTKPAVLHGNGPSKLFLNFLGNYVPNEWSTSGGCRRCQEMSLQLPSSRSEWPTVLLALFIESPTPFLLEVLEKVTQLDYPKDKISLWIHCNTLHHETLVHGWVELVQTLYRNVTYVGPDRAIQESVAKDTAINMCLQWSYDYLLLMDSLAMLDHAHTLTRIMETNRNVVAPLLVRPFRMFSNFWGDVAANGFYSRSRDYTEIIQRTRLGVWNVPFINSAVLIKGAWLKARGTNLPSFTSSVWDPDLAFCAWMRDKGHFMYVSNLEDYGHLLNRETYTTEHLHNDMYQLFDNRLDWERKYIHENYSKILDPNFVLEQPCTDVYLFPVMSEVFTKHLVEELEHFGQWSNGKNEDKRLQGGYENVPTVDIHMNQVGFESQWLEFLRVYIVPVQIKVFPGYYSKANALMNFVVKYTPTGQSFLRPHHDSSTFTINVALSRAGIEYEGGGCRFVRQNCSIVDTKLGWTLMHPGRLTHYHEGLPIVKGTRYIMVSFIDP